MKKRINLFNQNSEYDNVSPIEANLDKIGVIAIFVLFFAYLLLSLFKFIVNAQIESLTAQKKELIDFLLVNKNSEAKIIYFANKKDQLQTFLKDDAQFLPYYKLLKDLLVFSSESPILDSMILDKTKTTEFTVSFPGFDPAFQFLKYVESEKFLDNFIELTLSDFSISRATLSDIQAYKLHFRGRFKNINGNND